MRAGKALDERRLPRAVVSDDAEDLAPLELQIDAVETDHAAEGLDEAARLGATRLTHTSRVTWLKATQP